VTPSFVNRRVVADRLSVVDQALADIRALPLDRSTFLADRRNIWAAESCLRRGLEALFDLGRHILAKGFARGVSEYKQIATSLAEVGVLEKAEADVMRLLAGYRNRLVHFYHEIAAEELHSVCSTGLADLETIASAYRRWIAAHPEKVDPNS
jgi:uncharacterized protein YutE (UPF0331/DUF86 family)